MSAVKVSEIVSLCMSQFCVTRSMVQEAHSDRRVSSTKTPALALGAIVYLSRRHTRATYYNIAWSILGNDVEPPFNTTVLAMREHEFSGYVGLSRHLADMVEEIELEIDHLHEKRTAAREKVVETLKEKAEPGSRAVF